MSDGKQDRPVCADVPTERQRDLLCVAPQFDCEVMLFPDEVPTFMSVSRKSRNLDAGQFGICMKFKFSRLPRKRQNRKYNNN